MLVMTWDEFLFREVDRWRGFNLAYDHRTLNSFYSAQFGRQFKHVISIRHTDAEWPGPEISAENKEVISRCKDCGLDLEVLYWDVGKIVFVTDSIDRAQVLPLCFS